ncbi:LCP family protein [Niallia sp. Krafla_26]|uniref:LCP family glycopolymer transferase n=1 Tax=Niallia sp. Krafla_26 TaxID=3064703 RepID=UPI003D187068
MNTRTRYKKRRKKLRWRRIVLLTFLFFFVSIGLFGYNLYSSVVSAVDKMNNTIDRETSDKRTEEIKFNRKDPISILLVGVDERDGDAGRTDSMLVLTINPELKSTKMISIPRDTRAELVNSKKPNKNTISKMNHAYAFGGIEMTIESIEHFLNIPIDYYIEVNMEGFKDLVDAVGGIDVNNQYEFELDGTHLLEGQQHLNGEEALQYARMRKEDPLGDFGRQKRQQEVISKVIKKGASISSLGKYDDILEALQDNIKTNLTLDDILGIQKIYRPAADSITKLELDGEGKTMNKVWYYIVEDETRQELSNELRDHLDLPKDEVEDSSLY